VRRWLAGALLVTVGWLASPTSVPVYDGIGTDEPYRYAGTSPAPTTASTTVPLHDGSSAAIDIRTKETGPQFSLSLSSGALQAHGSSVALRAAPQKPSGSPPRGAFDSASYLVTATPAVTVTPDASGFLFMRAAVMTSPDPVIVFRATVAAPWEELATTRYGRDNLATKFHGTGEYAVVRLPGSKALSSGGLGLTRALLLGGGVLVLVVVTVLVLRRPRGDED
jgi:hypothetical protein